MQLTKKIPAVLIMLYLCFLNTSCSDLYESSIPDVSFTFNISANEIIVNGLDAAGTATYFPPSDGGYGGVWVVNGTYGYLAFDASCPYEASQVDLVGNEGIYGECPTCGTVYNWQVDGSTFAGDSIGGPGTEPLRQYSVVDNGFSGLQVFN